MINDGPGLMLVVEKLPWGNTLEVTKDVEQAIDEMRPGLPELNIDTNIFRPAGFVDLAIDHLTASLVLGALLVVLVLGLFLYDWRSALISVITMPLSLVAAGLVLYARGATINTMVLAGLVIALGAIVDDAIVDVENIVRRLRQARLRGKHAVDRGHHPRRLDRGPGRGGLRVVHRGDHPHPDLLPQQPDGLVLQAPRLDLRAGRAGLAARGAHQHAGPQPDPLSERQGRAPRITRGEVAASGLRADPDPIVRRPLPAYVALASLGVVGLAIVPTPRRGAVPRVQGAGLPHALDHASRGRRCPRNGAS